MIKKRLSENLLKNKLQINFNIFYFFTPCIHKSGFHPVDIQAIKHQSVSP